MNIPLDAKAAEILHIRAHCGCGQRLEILLAQALEGLMDVLKWG